MVTQMLMAVTDQIAAQKRTVETPAKKWRRFAS